jgi:hypothetical protein
MAYDTAPPEVPAGEEEQESLTAVEERPVVDAPRTRRTPHRTTMLDEVATDLAYWIDDTANKVALAFAPGRAPFSAELTEQQKLEFYKRQLFEPDGSPNQAGRARQIDRLGAENFSRVYKAVVQAYPELKPAEVGPPTEVPAEWPQPPPMPPMMPPGPPPPGPPMPPMPMPIPGGP